MLALSLKPFRKSKIRAVPMKMISAVDIYERDYNIAVGVGKAPVCPASNFQRRRKQAAWTSNTSPQDTDSG
jgi:hypothetical protein